MTVPHDQELSEFVHRWADAIASNGVISSGQLRHDTMSHEVLLVRELSDDIALLVTHATSSGAFDGNPIEADEWTSDVLVRAANGWKCTLTQLTPRDTQTP